VSYVVGFITAAFALMFLALYVWNGRFSRVAFVRKRRVVDYLIVKSSDISDLIRDFTGYVILKQKETGGFITRLFVLMRIICFFILILIIGALSYLAVLTNILFSAMIIWRGIEFNVHLSFIKKLDDILSTFDSIFSGLSFIFYPFYKLLEYLSFFSLDLSSVKVTCYGSQAPAVLMINFLILGIVIVFIQAEYSELQNITIVGTFRMILAKMSKINFRKFVIKDTSKPKDPNRNGIWGFVGYAGAVLLASIMNILVSFDLSRYAIQYAMSQVQISSFIFTPTGYHQSSPECDTALYGLDTILAMLSTAILWLTFFPALFIMSEVLCPKILGIGISGLDKGDKVTKDFVPKSTSHSIMSYLKLFSFLSLDLYAAAGMNKFLQRAERYFHEGTVEGDNNRAAHSNILHAAFTDQSHEKETYEKEMSSYLKVSLASCSSVYVHY